MIFVGFGFLMTFLRRYGYSAVCFNMVIAVLAIQLSIIVGGLLDLQDGKIRINIVRCVTQLYACQLSSNS